MYVVKAIQDTLHNARCHVLWVQRRLEILVLVLFEAQLVLPELKGVVEFVEQVELLRRAPLVAVLFSPPLLRLGGR